MIEPKKRALYIKRLVSRGLEGSEVLPAAERIELLDGAGLALSRIDKKASQTAHHTAFLLRECERHQLQFRELLKS